MNDKIIALLYTLLLLAEGAVMPFLWHWYMEALPEGATPATLAVVLVFIGLGQVFGFVWLWLRALELEDF